jgi:hypothetical protein
VKEITVKILYLVHDLSDSTVHKRAVMLRDGGASVAVAGFRRTAEPIDTVAGCETFNMGRTYNGGFAQRIFSILRQIVFLRRNRTIFENADIIIARNLEMLAIAVRGRSLCARPPVLVYESLDIHRLLLNRGLAGKVLRALEGWLTKRASSLITSSPAFVHSYFETLSQVRLPVMLIENKVYNPAMEQQPARIRRMSGPPWRIGWFGIIRCRKSLQLLSDLVRESNGSVEVVIRGRPAIDQIPDFHKITSQTPLLRFSGPYQNPEDLAAIYGDVHFSWAIDMYEEGLNSSWLLPNRLYEGGLFNTVPMAAQSVETGRFLDRLGLGVTLDEPLDACLHDFFRNLSPSRYASLEKSATEIPRANWYYTKQDCVSFVTFLSSLKDG